MFTFQLCWIPSCVVRQALRVEGIAAIVVVAYHCASAAWPQRTVQRTPRFFTTLCNSKTI